MSLLKDSQICRNIHVRFRWLKLLYNASTSLRVRLFDHYGLKISGLNLGYRWCLLLCYMFSTSLNHLVLSDYRYRVDLFIDLLRVIILHYDVYPFEQVIKLGQRLILLEHLVVGVLDALFFQLMLLLGRNIIFYYVLDGRGEFMPLTINP